MNMGGISDFNFGGWVRQGPSLVGQNRSFYALSEILTVPAPGTAHLLASAFAALLLVRRIRGV